MFNLAVPRATPSFPSCSPNFPRASTTRYTYAKQGSILYFLVALNCSLFGERQLISEVDIFDLVWRLWGYFLPYYSHIYFFFLASNLSNLTSVPKTELWVLQFQFPNSCFFILSILFSYLLFYCGTNYHLVMHGGEAGDFLVQLFKREEDTWIN